MSPDACGGHRGHRGARRNLRFALQASLSFLRRLHDTGNPELVTGLKTSTRARMCERRSESRSACGTQRAKPAPRARMSRAEPVTHARLDGGRLGAGNLGLPPPSKRGCNGHGWHCSRAATRQRSERSALPPRRACQEPRALRRACRPAPRRASFPFSWLRGSGASGPSSPCRRCARRR